MKGITGFRMRRDVARTGQIITDSGTNADALARVLEKLQTMGVEKFDAMSESEYGDWLDALPQDEFIALIGLSIE